MILIGNIRNKAILEVVKDRLAGIEHLLKKACPTEIKELKIQIIPEENYNLEEQDPLQFYQSLLAIACNAYDVKRVELSWISRKPEHVRVRQLFCWLLFAYTTLSLKQIGFQVNKIDHSTVIHHHDKLLELVYIEAATRKIFKSCMNDVEERFPNSAITERAILKMEEANVTY